MLDLQRVGPQPQPLAIRGIARGPDPQPNETAPSALRLADRAQNRTATPDTASVPQQAPSGKTVGLPGGVPVRASGGQHEYRARQWPPRPQRARIAEYRHAVSRRRSCPVCGGIDECLRRDFDSGEAWVWCVRCGEDFGGLPLPATWGYRQTHFFALDASGALRLPSAAQVTHASTHEAAADAPIEPLPIEQRDEALRLLARLLGQSAHHRAQLEARGYDLAACAPGGGRHLFASLPAEHAARAGVVAELIAALPWLDEAALCRLPGVSRKGRGPWAFLPHIIGEALLEFRRDELGRVWLFEYAPDTPSEPRHKRLWPKLDPTGLRVDRVHVARPRQDRQDAGAEIWLAEGGHKANLLADARATIALASLGKGNWRHFFDALDQLDPKRQRRIIVALDTDAWGEATTEVALIHELRRKGWRVRVARWDAAAAKGPDDALRAGIAIETREPEPPDPRSARCEALRQRRVDRRVTVLHEWQRVPYDEQARAAQFAAMLQHGAEALMEHARSGDASAADEGVPRSASGGSGGQELLAIVYPPGAGKTRLIAELGRPTTLGPNINIGLIAQRRDMAPLFAERHWNIIRACSPDYAHGAFCPNGHLHIALAQKGYNAREAHEAHHDGYGPCPYEGQFDVTSSAFYQIIHAQTSYATAHDLTLLDEVAFADWLPVIQVTIGKLKAAMPTHKLASYLARFIGALEAVIAERQPLHGRALFDALDARLESHLYEILSALMQDGELTNERPWLGINAENDPAHALERAEAAAPVIVPQTINAFAREVIAWRRGGEWNSQLQLQPVAAGPGHKGEWGLHITRRRAFGMPRKGAPAPLAVLDATADEELLARLFHRPVRLQRETIDPPPHTRHIAVRTGKRYGKRALTSTHGLDLARAAREVEYRLRDFDPDGAKRRAGLVGLITFKGAEAALAERLGIPYVPDDIPDYEERNRALHFFGCRGSNVLERCEILVLVGTPLLPADELARLARALWDDDPEPILEGVRCDEYGHALKDETGRVLYHDPRMQRLSDYLTESELAQCAHRIRPLRHDSRVILSYAVAGDLAYLPATEIQEGMPLLTLTGEDRAQANAQAKSAKLFACVAQMRAQGTPVNVATLTATANLRRETVVAWLKAERNRAEFHDMNRSHDAASSPMNSGANGLRVKVPTMHKRLHMQTGNFYALIPPTGIQADSAPLAEHFHPLAESNCEDLVATLPPLADVVGLPAQAPLPERPERRPGERVERTGALRAPIVLQASCRLRFWSSEPSGRLHEEGGAS